MINWINVKTATYSNANVECDQPKLIIKNFNRTSRRRATNNFMHNIIASLCNTITLYNPIEPISSNINRLDCLRRRRADLGKIYAFYTANCLNFHLQHDRIQFSLERKTKTTLSRVQFFLLAYSWAHGVALSC